MVITSDETANVTCKMRDRGQQENTEYHFVAAIRRLRTGKHRPEEKSLPNHVQNEQHISFLILLSRGTQKH